MIDNRTEISTFWSDDKSKKAVVYYSSVLGYEVDFFAEDIYIISHAYDGRSLQYHEDAAENYVMGIKQV